MSSQPKEENTALEPAGAGTIQRREFSAQQLEVQAETASSALAAQATAMVEARFIMAMRRPRDMDDVRQKMLRACERPGFAGSLTEKVWGAAWYKKPVGEGVEGFSIRFAEEALRALGNVDVQTVVTWDDHLKRIITVTVIDLEANVGYPTSIVVEKTVERKFLKKGQTAVRSRVNSYGDVVHLVEATDDEVFAKQNNLASKTIRNAVLRILPGDIQGECRARILAIRQGDIAKDLDGARRKISDAFGTVNVMPSDLKKLLGHDLATSTPAEIADLRELFQAIKDGKVTWADALREQTGEEDPAGDAPKTGLASVKDRLKAQPPTGGAPTPVAEIVRTAAPETAASPTDEESVRAFVEKTAGAPTTACAHPNAKVPAGKTHVCNDCTLDVKGPWPPTKGQRSLEE